MSGWGPCSRVPAVPMHSRETDGPVEDVASSTIIFDARAEGHRRRSQRAGTQIEKLYRHVSFQIALHSP